jgi:transcriptional regulator of NAD metabolism
MSQYKDSDNEITILRQEIASLNARLDVKKNCIPFPEGYLFEVKEISGTRYLVVSEPEPEIEKKEVIMSFPEGHRLYIECIYGHRFIGLYQPQKSFIIDRTKR